MRIDATRIVTLPIVTLPTEFHRGRYTAAVYRKLGVQDCVAADPDEYVDIALRLAADADFRRHVCGRIADTVDTLFNDTAAVEQLAGFFEAAVEEQRAAR